MFTSFDNNIMKIVNYVIIACASFIAYASTHNTNNTY